MKAKDVQIGEVYKMKIGANTTAVRITSQHPHGGWVGINVNTQKAVQISSADRLCGSLKDRAAEKSPTLAPVAIQSQEPSNTATLKEPRSRGQSGMAGAIKVLAEAGMPLNSKEIVDHMLEKGYWQTSGQTPAATIYSAIIREIATKGEQSRFRKAEKGKFMLNGQVSCM